MGTIVDIRQCTYMDGCIWEMIVEGPIPRVIPVVCACVCVCVCVRVRACVCVCMCVCVCVCVYAV